MNAGMTAAASRVSAAGGPLSLVSRFRGVMCGAVLGDCVGGEFEGAEDVPLDRVLQHLRGLEQDTRGILQYSDDTAMMRCVAHSLLTRKGFDEHDMAYRFATEYYHAPDRGYGQGVIKVLRKLASPQLSDVFQPAQAQFGGRGSFGNGGAMRAAPFALAFKDAADVRRYTRLGAMLTHSCSLGYNGAVLQAPAVQLALHGALSLPQGFINKLISEMEEVEKEEKAQQDAKALNLAEFPYCARLYRVKELIEKNTVSIEEVISELGNGVAALESVPTAIFCVLHCLESREGLPESYGGMERTITYSLALGGDTDTIACMAGAIAGAHYGFDGIPQSWLMSCEGVEEAKHLAEQLYQLYDTTQAKGDRVTVNDSNEPASHGSNQHQTKTE